MSTGRFGGVSTVFPDIVFGKPLFSRSSANDFALAPVCDAEADLVGAELCGEVDGEMGSAVMTGSVLPSAVEQFPSHPGAMHFQCFSAVDAVEKRAASSRSRQDLDDKAGLIVLFDHL